MGNEIGVRLNGDNSNFRGMLDQSTALANKFGGALQLIGVGVGAAAVLGFFKEVINKGGALQDLSDRLDHLSTDSLQAFDYAVRQAGGTTEQANITWDKAKKALDNLAAGSDIAENQFAALGLKAADFIGLGLDQSLEKIARAYQENADAAGAYDAITDILGSKSAPHLNAVLLELGEKGFGAVIAAAKEAGQVMDKEAIEKMDEFGDQMTKLKGTLQGWGAAVFGAFAKVAEVIGAVAANVANAFDGIETATWEESVGKAEVAVRKMLPPLAEVAGHSEKIAGLLEKERDARDALLSRAERMRLLQGDLKALEEFITGTLGTRKEKAEAVLETERIKIKLLQEEKGLQQDAEKHMHEMDALLAKQASEQKKNDERNLEVAKLLLKGRENLTETEQVRLDILTGATTQEEINYEIAQLTQKLLSGALIPGEEKRLRVLTGQTDELENQLVKMDGINKEVIKFISLGRRGSSYESQSTDALSGVRDRLKAQLDQVKQENAINSPKNRNSMEYAIQNEYDNVTRELNARKNVGNFANRNGEDAARQEYGDSLTDRALRDLKSSTDRTSTAIEDIQARLAKIFTSK